MGVRISPFQEFADAPHAVCKSGSHRGSHAKRFVNSAKVVEREPARHRSPVVLRFSLKALVSRVNRRMHILVLRFDRSTIEVQMRSGSG